MTDIRLDTICLLTAINEHDPDLTCFERADIDRVIILLDDAIKRQDPEAGNMQIPIIDFVVPAGVRHG